MSLMSWSSVALKSTLNGSGVHCTEEYGLQVTNSVPMSLLKESKSYRRNQPRRSASPPSYASKVRPLSENQKSESADIEKAKKLFTATAPDAVTVS